MPSTGLRLRLHGLRFTSHVLLVIQALSLGHLLLVRHVTCPEHGKITHASDWPDRAWGEVRQPSSVSTVLPQAQQRLAGPHDHCAICADKSRRFALLPPTAHFLTILKAEVALPPAARVNPSAPLALLLLAPKHSPPAG